MAFPPTKTCSAYPTNSTVFVITHAVTGSDIARQYGSMIVFLHLLNWELLLVGTPPLLQLSVVDDEDRSHRWTGSFSPCLLKFSTDYCKFLCITCYHLNANSIMRNYSWKKNVYNKQSWEHIWMYGGRYACAWKHTWLFMTLFRVAPRENWFQFRNQAHQLSV